jgi:hypothetical protein
MRLRNRFLIMSVVAGVLFAAQANAQIYRCDTGESIIFSDQPCDEAAEQYQSAGNVSVIEPGRDLAQVSERNREFIQKQRERQEAQRQARVERAREQRAAVPQQAPHYVLEQPVTRVMYIPEPGNDRRVERPRRETGSRRDDESDNRTEQPFSALSGRQLGSRRSDRDQERNRSNDSDRD